MSTLPSSPTNPVDGPTLAFGQHPPALEQLDDAEFFAHVAWKPGAPRALKNILAASNGIEGWADRLFAAAGANTSPRLERALWSRDGYETPARAELLFEALKAADAASIRNRRGAERKTAQAWGLTREWIAEHAIAPEASPVELLLLLELLAVPPSTGEAATYVSLWRLGLTAALSFAAAAGEPEGTRSEPDQRLLVLGELPYRLGLMYREVKGAGTVRRRGAQVLSAALLDNTDTDGMPHASLMPRFPLWLAALVRSAAAADDFAAPLWNDDGRGRFASLIRRTALLYHPWKQVPFSNGQSGETLPLLRQAAKLAGLRKQSPVRQYLRRLKKGEAVSGGKPQRKAGSIACQSDWAHLACLRNTFDVNSSSIVVSHYEHPPVLDLACLGNAVLQGPWDISLSLDGEAVSLDGSWSCVCWHTDRDVDYLELQLELHDGVRIDRQILFGRRDDYAVLADAVSGAGERRIDYSGRLTLGTGIELKPSSETRELRLRRRGTRVRMLPLSLPDDWAVSTAGSFTAEDNHLHLRQAASGRGLYASVLLDWSPKRRREFPEWRQLTVSEGGRALPAGRAAGQRVMIGELHLLVYRSLEVGEESRTVLGHHTLHETVIGSITKSGDIDPILLVE